MHGDTAHLIPGPYLATLQDGSMSAHLIPGLSISASLKWLHGVNPNLSEPGKQPSVRTVPVRMGQG